MSPTDSAILEEAEASELIAAAERKRRAARGQDRLGRRGRAIRSASERPRTGTVVADDDHADDGDEPEAEAGGEPVAKRKPRRRVMRVAGNAGIFPSVGEAEVAEPPVSGPGAVTRGVHAGLHGLDWTRSRAHMLGLWGIIAAAVLVTVVVLSFYAGSQAPEPMPVTGLRVTFLPGPRLSDQEVLGWIRRFPNVDKLSEGAPWVLDRLADYVRHQSVVAEVRQVSVVHQPITASGDKLRRVLELVIGLRQPVLPVVLASGERGWVDAEGWLLPGSLPGPTARRPVLRAIEWGGIASVRSALALWKQLEPQIEPGLITDIHLYDALESSGSQRGIVLYTRQGSRLIWGRPDEERFGVKNDDKIRDLVRTIRCQGDLSRVAAINVRFHQPFLVLRDAQRPPVLSARDAQP
jgi:hypothetical protein